MDTEPPSPPRRRGAQPGNHNALKDGGCAASVIYPVPPPLPAPQPPVSPPQRRRGAQPGNVNARIHGLYARDFSTRLSNLKFRLDLLRQSAASGNIPDPLSVQHTKNLISLAASEISSIREQKALRAAAHTTLKIIAWKSVLDYRLYRLAQPRLDLQYISANALGLVLAEFAENGITRDADSFRSPTIKSDQNSRLEIPPADWPASLCGSFLTDQQWDLIQPYIPPQETASPRGRTPQSPRQILDVIFTKFSNHIPWQDLPTVSPSIPTCRRYYRRLYRSGRLATLLMLLYEHLVTCGGVSLQQLAEEAVFDLSGNQIVLGSQAPHTWQVHTALLFLQLGLPVLRRLQREQKRAHRDKFPYRIFPYPSPHYLPPQMPSWYTSRAGSGSRLQDNLYYHHSVNPFFRDKLSP